MNPRAAERKPVCLWFLPESFLFGRLILIFIKTSVRSDSFMVHGLVRLSSWSTGVDRSESESSSKTSIQRFSGCFPSAQVTWQEEKDELYLTSWFAVFWKRDSCVKAAEIKHFDFPVRPRPLPVRWPNPHSGVNSLIFTSSIKASIK